MKRLRENKGALTIEASISYSVFLMIIVTILYLMRIVYAYGLVQHAVGQTAKELSMYTYVYQVTGMNEAYQSIQNSTSGRTEQFNEDAENIVSLYESLAGGSVGNGYSGTTNPVEILKNVGSVLVGEASTEANNQMFEAVVRPMIAGYIGADSRGNSADQRLQDLQVVGGIKGLDLSSSSFCEDGVTVDIVVCYTIDPLLPVDILPEMNLVNRACVRGMSGKTVFERQATGQQEEQSVWDMENNMQRGKAIQDQEHTRNLPDKFPVYSAYNASSGVATAERSINLQDPSYQKRSNIVSRISGKCSAMTNFRKTSYDGVTLDPADIKKQELIIYIPSSKGNRKIDRTQYDEAVRSVQERYPKIRIITKEID